MIFYGWINIKSIRRDINTNLKKLEKLTKFDMTKKCIENFLKKNKKSVDKEIKLMYNKNRSARAKQKSTLKSKQ